MTKQTLVAALAFLCLNASAQDVDKTFFLLGLMNKHNYQFTTSKEDIDRHTNDTLRYKFDAVLRQLKNEQFKDQVITVDSTKPGVFVYKNPVISKYLQSFFIQRESFNFLGEKYDAEMIDMGKLMDDNKKVYAYVAGVYCKYGRKDTANYCITLNASYKNMEALIYMLTMRGRGTVEYIRCCTCIPTSVRIKFTLYCDDVKGITADWVDKKLVQETQLFAQYLEWGKKLRK